MLSTEDHSIILKLIILLLVVSFVFSLYVWAFQLHKQRIKEGRVVVAAAALTEANHDGLSHKVEGVYLVNDPLLGNDEYDATVSSVDPLVKKAFRVEVAMGQAGPYVYDLRPISPDLAATSDRVLF